jgi:hypothetical protein
VTLGGHAKVTKKVLVPAESRGIEPALAATPHPDVWVYRYEDAARGWLLSIATHAEPDSGKLSLGGFRIAPESRTSLPGYDNDREAIELAIGMEQKVGWSRLLGVGGPRALAASGRLVGGKCVLRPSADARVGARRDQELLDFAISCFEDFERMSGVFLTTGQDLGHGTMSDGTTSSLAYLHERFAGSVLADTSRPTGEGNFQLLRGMLRACGVPIDRAAIALIGAGNIGRYILGRLREEGAMATALEVKPETRAQLARAGVRAHPLEERLAFLAQPADAVVVNAAGGSLDRAAIAAIGGNARVRVVCGSENLPMPDPGGAATLLAARKIFAPTELGGMMGYLTAVEEYLARREGTAFDVDVLLEAAARLDTVGERGTTRVIRSGYRMTFEDAVRAEFASAPRRAEESADG